MTRTVDNPFINNIHKDNIKDYELLLHSISKLSEVDFGMMVKAKFYLSNILSNVIPNTNSIQEYKKSTSLYKDKRE